MSYLEGFSSREIYLFLTFVLIFTLFIHWGGVNSYTRYDLTKALVEDQSVDIGPYSDNTVDKVIRSESVRFIDHLNGTQRATLERILSRGGGSMPLENRSDVLEMGEEVRKGVFEGREERVYADKAPMSSLLAIPAYVFVGSLGLEGDLGGDVIGDRERNVSTPFKQALEQFLITFTVPVLLGSLLLILIYRDIRIEIEAEDAALVAVLALGLASPLFHYSTTFFGVIAASFFGYLSFYIIKKYLEDRDTLYLLASGVAGGLAVSTEYYTGIIPVALSAYLWFQERDWQPTVYYVGAVVVGLAPMLLHNYLTMGNPFSPPVLGGFSRAVCQPYAKCFTLNYYPFVHNPVNFLNRALRLLVFPTRGLFFYSPVLLVALPGFVQLYRRGRRNLIYPAIFVLFLLFSASWKLWLAGTSFGPRYMVPAIPFLAIPLAEGMRWIIERGETWKWFLIVLIGVSVFHSMLGFNSFSPTGIEPEEYVQRFNSLEPVQPNFYPDLVDKFQRYGPRSEVLMSMFGREKGFDVTYRDPYGPEQFKIGELRKFILMETKWLPAILFAAVLSVLFFLWKDHERWSVFLAGAAIILLFMSLQTSSIRYGEGFYGHNTAEGNRWLSDKGEISFYSEGGENLYFEAGRSELLDSSSLEVFLNGEKVDSFDFEGEQPVYLKGIPLEEGRNSMELRSSRGCAVPEGDGDLRCLSFLIKNFTILTADEMPEVIYRKGWQPLGAVPPNSRWMGEEGVIFLDSGPNRTVSFRAGPASGLNRTGLNITVNGEHVDTIRFEGEQAIYLPTVSLRDGWNRVELESNSGCVSDRSENFCRSFLVKNLTLLSLNRTPGTVFYEGWSPLGAGEMNRWMGEAAEVMFHSEGEDELVFLKLGTHTTFDETIIEVSINGGDEEEYRVPGAGFRERILIYNGSVKGWNRLELTSEGGCVRREEACYSFLLTDFAVRNWSEFARFQANRTWFISGWSDEHSIEGKMVRWMRDKAILSIDSPTRRNVTFSGDIWVFNSTSRDLLITQVTEEEVRTHSMGVPSRVEAEIDFTLSRGINLFRFDARPGCESLTHRICLSLAFENFNFTEGW